MTTAHPDILIIGAGIAGLWTFHRLKKLGYDVLLLENDAIGGGQTIASQGILHAGLKYALTGKVNETARNISAMPQRWRDAMHTGAEVDLKNANILTPSQNLLIPKGFLGGLTKLVTTKALDGIEDIAPADWPNELKLSAFTGQAVRMNELVLDIPSVISALADPYKNCIRNADPADFKPEFTIHTAAQGNGEMAAANGHDRHLKTQIRPLLMGMLSPAPFELYAHLVGTAEKPVATITTHKMQSGKHIWYIGGQAAERAKDADQHDLYADIIKALQKYFPAIDLQHVKWASLPIDRIEGQSGAKGFMPDTPTIHEAENHLYCWPTKLTFAPLLSDMILAQIEKRGIKPGENANDYSALPGVDYALPPWDKAVWETH